MKIENVNMRKVIMIGGIAILIITALFILYRTDILFSRSNGAQEGSDSYRPDVPDNPDPDPEKPPVNPDWPGGINPSNIREGVRNRTIAQYELTSEERMFILMENAKEWLPKTPTQTFFCREPETGERCVFDMVVIGQYSNNQAIGLVILQCSGNLIANWNAERKEYIFDVSQLRCG